MYNKQILKNKFLNDLRCWNRPWRLMRKPNVPVLIEHNTINDKRFIRCTHNNAPLRLDTVFFRKGVSWFVIGQLLSLLRSHWLNAKSYSLSSHIYFMRNYKSVFDIQGWIVYFNRYRLIHHSICWGFFIERRKQNTTRWILYILLINLLRRSYGWWKYKIMEIKPISGRVNRVGEGRRK